MTKNRALAEAIALSLFTNGRGQRAERLRLWLDSTGKDLGGWCERAVADQIEDALNSAEKEAHV